MGSVPTLDRCRDIFQTDGSLRDLYVTPTNLKDWQRFMDFSAGYPRAYFVDGNPGEIPDRIGPLLSDSQQTHLMRLDLWGVTLNCHFFTPEEIELDIDPAAITTEASFSALTDFMQSLGTALGKDVILTHENRAKDVLIRFACGTSEFAFA